MADENKKIVAEKKQTQSSPRAVSVEGNKNAERSRSGSGDRRRRAPRRDRGPKDEFDQKIVDLARVTRVMAGGKRMRFRACVVVGDRKGKVGVGLAKSADVSNAISKATEKAKKNIITVQIINETIAHPLNHKYGAARVMLKPATKGRGIIAGGAVRIVLEMAGLNNVVSKILGTNNPVSNAQCVIEALQSLKHIEIKKENKEKPEDKEKKGDKQVVAESKEAK
jgi:small subunit ribosomal protein S5